MARAVNDWIAREWLDRDPRLRASIVVPQQNAETGGRRDRALRAGPALRPGDAAGRRDYRWAGGRTGRSTPRPNGMACRSASMPAARIAIRTRRSAGRATLPRNTSTRPSAFQTQLTSLITEGVFAKFPDLTVVLMESGVTWLPGYLWRLTKFWKGLRSEVPWVSDPPAHDRARPGAPDAAAVRWPAGSGIGHAVHGAYRLGRDAAVLDRLPALAVRGDRAIPEGLDPGLAQKIMVDNPLRTYARLNEKETTRMNVDVLNRSGLQAAPLSRNSRSPTATCIRARRASASAGSASRSIRTCRSAGGARRDVRHPLSPALGEGIGLSEGPAAGVPPRRLAEWRISRQRSAASWPSSTSTRTTSRSASSIR